MAGDVVEVVEDATMGVRRAGGQGGRSKRRVAVLGGRVGAKSGRQGIKVIHRCRWGKLQGRTKRLRVIAVGGS